LQVRYRDCNHSGEFGEAMARAIGVVDRSHELKDALDRELARAAHVQSLAAVRRFCEVMNQVGAALTKGDSRRAKV
jgi:hypothetical protein